MKRKTPSKTKMTPRATKSEIKTDAPRFSFISVENYIGDSSIFVKARPPLKPYLHTLNPYICFIHVRKSHHPLLHLLKTRLLQVKERDPPLFGERFSFVTDMLVTSAATKRASDKGTTTLYVAPALDLNRKPVWTI